MKNPLLKNLNTPINLKPEFVSLPDGIEILDDRIICAAYKIGKIGFARVLFQNLKINKTVSNHLLYKFNENNSLNIIYSNAFSIFTDKDNFIELTVDNKGIYINNSLGTGIINYRPVYATLNFITK